MFACIHCPDCASAVAARATIMEDPDLWVHIMCVFAPFVPLAIVALALHRVGPIGDATRPGDRG